MYIYKILNSDENSPHNVVFSTVISIRTKWHEMPLVKERCRFDVVTFSIS